MARDRSIVVRLKAEVADFNRQMGGASRTLSDFEREQQRMGGAADTALGRMAQNAKINQQEWQTVGRTLVATGAAVTAMGGAALKVGIDYNSLRQSATQSLTAVTGSTELAANQMQKLDDYGRNSWLMRDTLIRAQQQMTGFGISTEKVIPYMDGLAEAVAAAGGSNQDFEELAVVMGQVQSQGKITARELDQFGRRGIDAAGLIGEAMGKTSEQIRSEITAGTLDAGEALDALAEGMKTRFDGASDLVRNTYQGALDDVKGAFRDLMADIAKPLVDPEGGGLLVGLMNRLSDVLQLAEKLPRPVKTAGLAIGGLGSTALIAGGGFLVAVPKIAEFHRALDTIASTSPKVSSAIRGMKNAIGPLSGALAAAAVAMGVAEAAGDKLNDALFGVAQTTEQSTAHILADLGRETGVTAGAIDEMANTLDFLEGGLGKTGDGLKSVMDWTMPLSRALPDPFDKAKEKVESYDGALVDMIASGNIQEAKNWAEQLKDTLLEQGWSVEEVEEALPGYENALQGMANEQALAAESTGILTQGIETMKQGLSAAREKMIGDLKEVSNSFIDLGEAQADSVGEFMSNLEKQVQAQSEWAVNMEQLTERAFNEMEGTTQTATLSMLNEVARMGPEGADLMALFNDMTTAELSYAATLWYEKGRQGGVAINDGVLSAGTPEVDVELNTANALSSMSTLISNLSGRAVSIRASLVGLPSKLMSKVGFADGGIMQSYADGGFSSLPKQAMIQAATPGLVQWAEPETRGEAFIPLAPGKRRRSLAIWEETGRRLGALPKSFADGGLNIPAPGPSYSSVSNVGGHTINVYGVQADSTSEVAKAVLFASRKQDRGGVYNR